MIRVQAGVTLPHPTTAFTLDYSTKYDWTFEFVRRKAYCELARLGGKSKNAGSPQSHFRALCLGLFVTCVLVSCGGGSSGNQASAGPAGTGTSLAIPATSPHPSIRTRYLRTDLQYGPNSLQFFPPHFTAYDATNKRFFMSNTTLNHIDVFDAQSEAQIGSILIPSPWGLDVAPGGTKLYVGTSFGDVYLVDPVAMKVVQRYASATLGSQGYAAVQSFVLADGRLALLGAGNGFAVDGYPNFVVWDPVANSLQVIGPQGFTNIGQITISADRTKVFVASADSDATLMRYDTATGSIVTRGQGIGIISQILPAPDGKRLFVTSEMGTVAVSDAATLAVLETFTFTNGSSGGGGLYGAVLSQDGTALYGVDLFGNLLAYDTNSFTQKGWVANFKVIDGQEAIVPSAIDETGLIAGPIGHGVAFVDGAQINAGSSGSQFNVGFLSPNTGPLKGGTVVQDQLYTLASESITSATVYLGNGTAANVSFGQGSDPLMNASVPAASFQGPADLTLVLPDHSLGLMPEDFSYGPAIVEVSPNAATAEGGGQGVVFGYGLGQQVSDVEVTVGGQPAPVTQLVTNASPIYPYPFPMEAVLFTIPAGTAGIAADIIVTTGNGSAKASGGVRYVGALQSFPLSGSSLSQGIYDPHRGVVYFADRAQIQVFSVASRSWIAPIPISYAGGNARLQAVALSQDGNTLAISDSGEGNIYTLNPSSSGIVNSFHVQQNAGAGDEPCGLAVNNAGVVYYSSFQTGGTGWHAFHKLDTGTGTITELGDVYDYYGAGPDYFIRVFLSPDQSRVYINENGITHVLNTSDDSTFFSPQTRNDQGSDDMAFSEDGTTLETSGFLTDANVNPFARVTYVDRDVWLPEALYGQKLSADGGRMFQPLIGAINGIDVIDGATGLLLNRIAFATQVADVYDTLAIDDTDNLLFIITSTGISQLDLTSLPAARASSEQLRTIISAGKRSIQSGSESLVPTTPFRDDHLSTTIRTQRVTELRQKAHAWSKVSMK